MSILLERMENRDYVDKEHILSFHNGDVQLFFKKETPSTNAIKDVEELLIDLFESRVCGSLAS